MDCLRTEAGKIIRRFCWYLVLLTYGWSAIRRPNVQSAVVARTNNCTSVVYVRGASTKARDVLTVSCCSQSASSISSYSTNVLI